MTEYFDEISAGCDALLDEKTELISLSPEMGFLELKLNECKNILEKRERDARQAEERKNDLVVYLAHDIRTPLTSVIGYLDLMKEAPDLPVEQRGKYLSITLDKAYRLEQLINEFFEITRFNLHNIPLTKENIPLSFLLMQLSEEFYPILTPGGKSVHLNVPEDLILPGDPDKLARVFNNILKNAAAYSLPEYGYRDSRLERSGADSYHLYESGSADSKRAAGHDFRKVLPAGQRAVFREGRSRTGTGHRQRDCNGPSRDHFSRKRRAGNDLFGGAACRLNQKFSFSCSIKNTVYPHIRDKRYSLYTFYSIFSCTFPHSICSGIPLCADQSERKPDPAPAQWM